MGAVADVQQNKGYVGGVNFSHRAVATEPLQTIYIAQRNQDSKLRSCHQDHVRSYMPSKRLLCLGKAFQAKAGWPAPRLLLINDVRGNLAPGTHIGGFRN